MEVVMKKPAAEIPLTRGAQTYVPTTLVLHAAIFVPKPVFDQIFASLSVENRRRNIVVTSHVQNMKQNSPLEGNNMVLFFRGFF